MKHSKKLEVYFILLPFIDLITALLTRNTNLSITPGIIIKSIFLLVMVIYIFRTKSKYQKVSLYLLLLSLIYIIGYFAVKPGILNWHFIITELTFIFKLIYFPISFMGLLCIFDDNNYDKSKINKILKYTLIIYILLLIIPLIFNIAYTTYPTKLKGYIGLFYAGNEIANIMILLLPFAYLYLEKNKYSFLILFPIVLTITLIGTKVATFGCLIITLITFIFCLVKQKFKIKSSVIKTFLILAFTVFISINSYAVYNYNYMKNYYYKDETKEIIIDENNKKEVEEISKQITDFYNKNQLSKIIRPLISGRDMLLANTLSVYNDINDDSNIWFGIGFSNTPKVDNTNIGRLIEIDICDLYFHFGLLGLVVSLYPFIFLCYKIIKNWKKITLNCAYLITILLLIAGISTLSGHVLFAPAVSIYLVLYLLLITLEIALTGRRKLKDKISILSLHLNVGGIEKTICDQANMLSEKYKVEIITLYNYNSSIPYNLNKNVKIKYLTNLKPNKDDFKKYLKDKNILMTLKEGLKAIKILYLKRKLTADYIYNSDSKIIISTRLFFTKLLNEYKNPEAITIAEEHVYHHNNKCYIHKLDKLLKHIDYLLPASNYLTMDYKQMLKTNTVINYIPLTINYFPKNKSKREKDNIIAVGRLEKEKGFIDLIEVMSKAVKKNKNLKLTIIGDGSQRAIIENKIKELKLDKNIKITGFISQEEIKKYYEKASLLINTSYEESFGLVLLEAASYGIPSLAFSSALGAVEIIGKNFGKIIDNRDLNKMSKAIVDYTNGSLTFNYDEIRNHAKNYYTETVKNNWFEFIEKAKLKQTAKRVMFISSEGGHFSELLELNGAIEKYNSFIITEKNFLSKESKLKYGTRINFLLNTKPKKISYLILAPINILYSMYYYFKIKPDVVITTGAHTAVAMCYIAKLFRKKIIYIETFANLESKTLTGRLIYPIADVFIVQWESMRKLYPKATYIGGVY